MTEEISPATSRVVLDTEWFSVHEETFAELPPGKPYYRVHAGTGVVVLALTAGGGVVLVRQFRPILRRHTLEIPAGGVEAGETPAQAAERELLEETGYAAPRLIPLGSGFLSVDRLDTEVHAFLAPGVVPAPGHAAAPDIEVTVAPWAGFLDHVRTGRFRQMAALGLVTRAAWEHGLDLFTGLLKPSP